MNEPANNTDKAAQENQVVENLVDNSAEDTDVDAATALALIGAEDDPDNSEDGETSTSDESDEGGDATETESDSLDASATGEREETDTLATQDSDSSEGTDEGEDKAASELNLDEIVTILRAGDEVPEGVNPDLVRGANALIESETTKEQFETLKTKVIKDPYTLLTDEQKAQIEECEATEGKHAAFNLTKKLCDEVTKEAVQLSPEMREAAVREHKKAFITKLAKDNGLPLQALQDEMPIGLYNKIKNNEISFEVGMAQAVKQILKMRGVSEKLTDGSVAKTVDKAPKIRKIGGGTAARPSATEMPIDTETASTIEMLGLG